MMSPRTALPVPPPEVLTVMTRAPVVDSLSVEMVAVGLSTKPALPLPGRVGADGDQASATTLFAAPGRRRTAQC